jgi:hypothetical protein
MLKKKVKILRTKDEENKTKKKFILSKNEERIWICGGLNPGLLTCEASTLPLSYNPLSAATAEVKVK